MLDLLVLATMTFVCGAIGLPIARLLPDRFAWRLALAPIVGYAMLAVAVPVAYCHGVTIPAFFYAVLVLAAASVALHIRPLARTGWGDRRLLAAFIAVCALATIILLAPRWVGGDQYAVFQGNHWDTFGYLDSAVVYARKPFGLVANATDREIAGNPLYALAAQQLDTRPSVHQLYAVFSRVAPLQAYRLHYTFLVFSVGQFVPVAVVVVRNAFPRMPPKAWFAVSLVFPLGFWGQYVFDINAWSQIAATPLLFLIFGLLLDAATVTGQRPSSQLRVALVLGVSVAGAVFLYPEGFLIYAAAMFPLATTVIAYAMVRARRFELARLLPLLGALGVLAVILYGPQLAFVRAQLKWTSGPTVPWWDYFQGFFAGRDHRFDTGRWTDFVAGFFGLYFATPLASAGVVASAARRVAIAVTIGGLLGGMSSGLRRDDAEHRRRYAVWGVAAILLLAPAAWFVRSANYWPAGKVVSYVAPVFVTFLSLAIGFPSRRRPIEVARWITVAFVGFQIATGVMRIFAAARADGVHYALPYPSVQGVSLKHDVPWDLRPLEQVLGPATHVQLHAMDPFLENYVIVFLWARRIPFAVDGPVNTYFGKGRVVPAVAPPWTPDVDITRDGTALLVQFRTGRAPVRLTPP